jgi:hypothetical protein
MSKCTVFVGMDVHAETIAVVVAEGRAEGSVARHDRQASGGGVAAPET